MGHDNARAGDGLTLAATSPLHEGALGTTRWRIDRWDAEQTHWAMAQTGGVLLLSSLEDPSRVLVYFMGIDGAKFRRPVRPGDQLRFVLTMLKFKGRICKMRGEAYVEDQLVAEADLLSSIVEHDRTLFCARLLKKRWNARI